MLQTLSSPSTMPSEQVSPALQEEHLSGHLLSLRTSSSMIVSFLKELTFPEVLLRGLGRGRDPAGAKNQSDKSGDREV